MALWCTDCEKFVPADLGFCEECGTDLIWGGVPSNITPVSTKECEFCYNTVAIKGADICGDCQLIVLESGADRVEAAANFPDLCPECLLRLIAHGEGMCKPCYASEVWGGELADDDPFGVRAITRGSEYDYWTGASWPEPAVIIPSVAEELETIPARRR
jgi:hypothetical protein